MGMRIGAHANIDKVSPADLELLAADFGLQPRRIVQAASILCDTIAKAFADVAEELHAKWASDVDDLVSKIQEGIEQRRAVVEAL